MEAAILRFADRRLARRDLRAVASVLLALLLASPLAVLWGLSHAEVEDYLGPHATTFSVNFESEIALDLGPVGNAYMPSPGGPLGLRVEVGGISAAGGSTSFFSEATISEYLSLYTDPRQAMSGVLAQLIGAVIVESIKAELVLLALWVVWTKRRWILRPHLFRQLTSARGLVVYIMIATVMVGSAVAPFERTDRVRIPISLARGTQFEGLTVDSALLFTVIDRGIKSAEVLAGRQFAAIDAYIEDASTDLNRQSDQLAVPGPDESMLLGFSDLHCSIAMTEVIRRLVAITNPSVIMSSGDDTMNGTAAEKGCVTRESAIAGQERPFVVATGNHDSDVTDAQMQAAGMEVLDGDVLQVDLPGRTDGVDGEVLEAHSINFLGDDDPERNPPFSMERVQERAETVPEMGARLADQAAGKDVDVILVHQPAGAEVITAIPNPPARLIMYGHFHDHPGPAVLLHDDGSWSVSIRVGTAGGVKQPTLTAVSTPFSPPRTNADVYLFFRDNTTGLITGVQPIHFRPDSTVLIEPRIPTGSLELLPPETRDRLVAAQVR